MGAGIPGGPAGPVQGESPIQVLGNSRVERAVAAAEDVDVRHAGIIGVDFRTPT
jgi:hypothetical protein